MTLLQTLAYYRTALFYYILGGITFVPFCVAVIFLHFWLTAPPYEGSSKSSKGDDENLGELIGEGDLSEERKKQALDLAVWNKSAEKEAEERKKKSAEDDNGPAAIPAAARRVNPPAPQKRPHRAGWLTVRRHFQNEGVNLALREAAQQAAKKANTQSTKTASNTASNGNDAKSQGYMSMMYRNVLNYRNQNNGKGPNGDGKRSRDTTHNADSGASTPDLTVDEGGVSSGSTTIQPVNQNSANNANASAQASAAKETFYCILKGPILYLYSSADPSNPETECHAAIDLRGKRISIYVAHEGDTMGEPIPEYNSSSMTNETSTDSVLTNELEKDEKSTRGHKAQKKARVRDGELFVKRNAIRIVSMGGLNTRTSIPNSQNNKIRFAEWFVFAKNAFQLEDWYHAFISASILPEGPLTEDPPDLVGSVFSIEDMTNLLASLDNVPDPIPLRWLNAMVGRIFFSIYRTAWLEDYITRKFRKKISRVRTPGFLSDIRIREVDLGHTPPAFSRAMLKSLTGDGEASMEVSVHYTGSLRLTISTVLTISLGSRFKQYTVNLLLAVILNSLEGNLLLHIKPPPSNRVWFGFTKLPKMDISVEPVVSERKVQWSMVKRLIEGKIRELMTESLVLPNMDDIPFFDTRSFEYRGGIWSGAAKNAQKTDADEAEEDAGTTVEHSLPSQSKSTPTSVLNMSTDESSLGGTTALEAKSTGSLRNRYLGGEMSNSETALLSTSPAAAGLSSLLARDQAASSGSTSAGTAKPPSKRRSWFVGRSNSPTLNKTTNRKSNTPQSSLAWGSASLTTNNQSTIQDNLLHERNKLSISSSIDEGGDETDTSVSQIDPNENVLYAESDQMDLSDAEHHEIGQDDIPSVHLENMDGTNDEEVGLVAVDDGNVTAKAEHFPESSQDTEIAEQAQPVPPLSVTKEAGASATPPSVPPRPGNAQASGSSILPPPSRSTRPSPSSTISFEREQQRSPAVQSLASLQKERYGPTSTDEMNSRSAATQAALLHTWNKAKASMADKDSRQAAAKEAKDALKRGWASWNARRAGQAGSAATMDTILTSSDRLGESGPTRNELHANPVQPAQDSRSRSGSWLASSPEDPASLGVGFDGHGLISSPSNLSLDAPLRGRDSDISGSSRASSVAGRRPYREHRADRLKKENDSISRSSSRASSIHSTDQVLTPPPVPTRTERYEKQTDVFDPSTSKIENTNSWDASVPGLSAPVPAAQREKQPDTNVNQASLSSSPTAIRRTIIASSGNSNATGGSTLSSALTDSQSKPSYSFLPGQPTATIGLSGVDLPSLSKTDGTSTTSIAGEKAEEGLETQKSKIDSRSDTIKAVAEVQTSPGLPQERRVSSASNVDTSTSPLIGTSSTISTPPKGIKQQPIRATMMAVPGIPSMQKAGPQSFEAPKPSPPNVHPSPKGASANTLSGSNDHSSLIGGSPRLGLGGLMARMPSFGTVSTPGTTETILPNNQNRSGDVGLSNSAGESNTATVLPEAKLTSSELPDVLTKSHQTESHVTPAPDIESTKILNTATSTLTPKAPALPPRTPSVDKIETALKQIESGNLPTSSLGLTTGEDPFQAPGEARNVEQPSIDTLPHTQNSGQDMI